MSGVRSRGISRRIWRHDFLTHNAMAAVGTILAGLLGLLLQAFVSHHFQPGKFGGAFTVLTYFLVLSQPAGAFSRMIAWSASREVDRASTDEARHTTALVRITNLRLLAVGAVAGLGSAAAAPVLSSFLHVPDSYIFLGALGSPFLFATSPLLGLLQGEQRWASWSTLTIGVALSRLICVAIFVFPFGVTGVQLGVSVGAALVYLVALIAVWPQLRMGSGQRASWKSVWPMLVIAIASTAMIAVLMGIDVLLVEHFFSRRQGGQFSIVAVTSRALYFGMGSLGIVLFPKAATRHARGRSTLPLVIGSLAIALAGGVVGLSIFSLGSHLILHSFSGAAYEAASSYLGIYALGMPLLAGVLILTNTQQASADLRLLWILVPGILLKPVLILLFHQSLMEVAVMSDLAIGIVLLSLATRYALVEALALGPEVAAARSRVLPSAGEAGVRG